ncbi:hypothetical protein CXB51_014390 [Gossypium anomalum]|uniref:RNase H type-1 domain-containing protein n=1 Tax=Gossypium anomalum TaxID=47600 RepID=A0A8J5Z050_9ROSI|nr:hypothetical protein CXB51_014390 [Gossypium anomalum]
MCTPKAQEGIDFRDVSIFNNALLVKQGWKLTTNSTCLLALVMKANILEDGIGWRIGNGRTVNIWNDAWILGPGDGKVEIQNIDNRYSKVANLINSETDTWKTDLVEILFMKEPSEMILTIPLVNNSYPNALIWMSDNTGEYLVKSGSVAGVIIRNNLGLVTGSCVYSIENVQDPTMVEAHACLQAVIFVKEMGFGDICVEGDALTVEDVPLDIEVIVTKEQRWFFICFVIKAFSVYLGVAEAPPINNSSCQVVGGLKRCRV